MKTAVVYYSLEGNTKRAAERIAATLQGDLLELAPEKSYPTGAIRKFFFGGKSATFKEAPPLKPYSLSVGDYDLIVVGSPIWAGTIAPPLRSFLRAEPLADRKLAAFLCCGGGKADKAFAAIREESGCTALAGELRLVNVLKDPALEATLEAFCRSLAGE